MIGGSDGTQSLCSTEIYDPETNTWMPGPPMTTCRANVGVAVVNDKLYAVGGFSGKTTLCKSFCFYELLKISNSYIIEGK